MEVRRLLEPMATALAATRISGAQLAEVKRHLDAMREARDDVEQLNAHDAAFHRAVVSATGNETLLTLLEGISGRTLRARNWRGLVDDKAAGRTLAEHEAIFTAPSTRDAALSQAAALLHVQHRAVAEGTPALGRALPPSGRQSGSDGRALPAHWV
jgi:GntR family transcriptional repressor for pyruvate dehydrogenase complex